MEKLIDQTIVAEDCKEMMHFIRKSRNKVHPNNIKDFEDVNRNEAIVCRNYLEQIIAAIYYS